MKFVLGTLSAFACILIVVVGILSLRREQPRFQTTPPPSTPATSTPAVTESPTESPTETKIGWVGGRPFLYPKTPLFEMKFEPRRWEFRAGAVVPGLEGMKIDEATETVISTYPGVTVRVVDQADALNLEVRRDRITIIADLFTRRVVSARVG